MKKGLLFIVALAIAIIGRAQTLGTGGNEFITSPQGTDHAYSLSAYTEDFSAYTFGGALTHVYYNETDETVYIKNLIRNAADGSYVKGALTEGDFHNGVITIPNNQLCGSSTLMGLDSLYAVVMHENENGKMVADFDAESYTFQIKNDSIVGDVYLAAVSSGDTYYVQGQYNYVLVDMSKLSNIVMPEGVEAEKYKLSTLSSDGGNRSDAYYVNIARSGNDFYFANVFDEEDDAVFKGTLNGSKIEIQLPEFVMSTSNYRHDTTLVYLNTCRMETDTYVPNAPSTLQLTYDETDGHIYADDDVVLALLNGNVEMKQDLFAPHFDKSVEVAPVIPENAEVKLYAMNSEYDDQGHHQGGVIKVGRDGNNFYFTSAYLTSWENAEDLIFVATLDPATNTMTIPSRQFIGFLDGESYYVGPAKSYVKTWTEEDEDYGEEIEHNDLAYEFDPDKDVITLKYDPEKDEITSQDIIGIFDNAFSRPSVYYIYPTYTATSYDTIPADADTMKYVCIPATKGMAGAKEVNICKKDNKFYFTMKLDNRGGTGVFTGTLDGNTIHVAMPQLLTDNYYGYMLRSGNPYKGETVSEDIDAKTWDAWEDDDRTEVTFNYDAQTGVITSTDSLVAFALMRSPSEWDTYSLDRVTYQPFVLGPATPKAPYDLTYEDKEEDWLGRYDYSFYIANESVDGIYLSYDSISYRLYFDTEDNPLLFTPEDFGISVEKETYDVWFNAPASENLPHPYYSENARTVYYSQCPQTRFGVQTGYHYNGEVYYSEITWFNITTDGISTVNGSNVENVSFFDLSGRKVAEPAHGIFIRSTRYANGKVENVKMVK